jgi:DNA polymerase sigma
MKNWIDRIPGMQRILILLKYIMYIRGFNCNFNGGIGSYGLFVMVAAYMQTNPQVHAADSSTVFMGLLRWYGEEFDNLNNAVRLREEGSCFIKHNEVEIE